MNDYDPTKQIIMMIVVSILAIIVMALTGCGTVMDYVKVRHDYEVVKKQCEDEGRVFSGDVMDIPSWKCVLPPEPIIDPVAPKPAQAIPEPVIIKPAPVEVVQCKSTKTTYCGGAPGYTFKSNGRVVEFIVTGIEDVSPTRFIYWMEDGAGNWYNSVIFGKTHRGIYNDALIQHGDHKFSPDKEYKFIIKWGDGFITQEIYESGSRICEIKHQSALGDIKWAKIGKAAHGENAFIIKEATIR